MSLPTDNPTAPPTPCAGTTDEHRSTQMALGRTTSRLDPTSRRCEVRPAMRIGKMGMQRRLRSLSFSLQDLPCLEQVADLFVEVVVLLLSLRDDAVRSDEGGRLEQRKVLLLELDKDVSALAERAARLLHEEG